MRASVISAAALLLASANAISILTPTKDEIVDLNDYSFTVTWETVSTDPTSAHLFLVNMAGGHTPYSKDLGVIDLTKGSYTVSKMTVDPDTDYQFNLESETTNNQMGILAQSEQFQIIKSNSTSSSGSSSTITSSGSSTATGGAGSNPGVSTVSTPTTTLSTSTASSTAGSKNGTSTATAAKTTSTSGSNAVKVAGGSILALMLGAVAVLA